MKGDQTRKSSENPISGKKECLSEEESNET